MDYGVGSTFDLISNLPDNTLENILIHLPLQDAVRTSILSKKWRHKWKTIPQLVFDHTFEANLKSQPPSKNELLLTIYHVLLLHYGPVNKFTLSIYGLGSCHEIDPIVEYLSRNGIQELTLRIKSAHHYNVHSCLFSCQKLRNLHLSSCLFRPPVTFNGCNRLVSAKLKNVNFDANGVQNLILKCPLLEKLTLYSCKGADHLDIYAPNLKYLCINLFFQTIRFRYTPFLAIASITWSMHGVQSIRIDERKTIDMLEIFGCLPGIESLHLGVCFSMHLTVGNIPERLPTSFNHLKKLSTVTCLDDLANVACALCLIKSCHYLQELTVKLMYRSAHGRDSVVEFLEFQNLSDVSFCGLKEVSMGLLVGSKPEIEFVKLLLAKSPLLETMYISRMPGPHTNEAHILLNEIARFPRASTLAEIVFK